MLSLSFSQIRFGLAAVKNVGAGAIESILEARNKGGEFKSLIDFCRRVDLRRVNRRVAESLIKCEAFDAVEGGNRHYLLSTYEDTLSYAQKRNKDLSNGQTSYSIFYKTLHLTGFLKILQFHHMYRLHLTKA